MSGTRIFGALKKVTEAEVSLFNYTGLDGEKKEMVASLKGLTDVSDLTGFAYNVIQNASSKLVWGATALGLTSAAAAEVVTHHYTAEDQQGQTNHYAIQYAHTGGGAFSPTYNNLVGTVEGMTGICANFNLTLQNSTSFVYETIQRLGNNAPGSSYAIEFKRGIQEYIMPGVENCVTNAIDTVMHPHVPSWVEENQTALIAGASVAGAVGLGLTVVGASCLLYSCNKARKVDGKMDKPDQRQGLDQVYVEPPQQEGYQQENYTRLGTANRI